MRVRLVRPHTCDHIPRGWPHKWWLRWDGAQVRDAAGRRNAKQGLIGPKWLALECNVSTECEALAFVSLEDVETAAVSVIEGAVSPGVYGERGA